MRIQKTCLSCDKPPKGRIDKKFCDPFCKSGYHYKKSQEYAPKFYNKVENLLKLNRIILKEYNNACMTMVRAEVLLNKGFDTNFFTHYWKNQKGDAYLFVNEYGFLKRQENGREKYVLILSQENMNT